jgi:hypothetical protein
MLLKLAEQIEDSMQPLADARRRTAARWLLSCRSVEGTAYLDSAGSRVSTVLIHSRTKSRSARESW